MAQRVDLRTKVYGIDTTQYDEQYDNDLMTRVDNGRGFMRSNAPGSEDPRVNIGANEKDFAVGPRELKAAQTHKRTALRTGKSAGRTGVNRPAYEEQFSQYVRQQSEPVRVGRTAEDIKNERGTNLTFDETIQPVMHTRGDSAYATVQAVYDRNMYENTSRSVNDTAERHQDMEDGGEVNLTYSAGHDEYHSDPYAQNLLLGP